MAFFVFVLFLLEDDAEAAMVTPLWFVRCWAAGWLFAGKNVWRNKGPTPGNKPNMKAPAGAFLDFRRGALRVDVRYFRTQCISTIISLMPLLGVQAAAATSFWVMWRDHAARQQFRPLRHARFPLRDRTTPG